MKKARIMLMAIAVFGVVGGALAFKAHNFSSQDVFCRTTTANVANACTITSYQTLFTAGFSTTLPCTAKAVAPYTSVWYKAANCTALPSFTSTVYSTVVQ